MKIKRKKPFLAYILAFKFPMILEDTTTMVWGDTMYRANGNDNLQDHFLAHEQTHIRQQKNKLNGIIWWIKYSFSKQFRLNQEIEAYRKQYKVLGDPRLLHQIATDLSGRLYGNIISYDEAVRSIKL